MRSHKVYLYNICSCLLINVLISRLPAKYFDPVTQLPYYNVQAFKILREAYYLQLEERGNPDNSEVAKWLEWRKMIKENRSKANKNCS